MMTSLKYRHLWRNFNGPGKPITEEQMQKLLAKQGVYPVTFESGQQAYLRKDVVAAWQKLQEKRKMGKEKT